MPNVKWTNDDRILFKNFLTDGTSMGDIAIAMHTSRSKLYYELAANHANRDNYDPVKASERVEKVTHPALYRNM